MLQEIYRRLYSNARRYLEKPRKSKQGRLSRHIPRITTTTTIPIPSARDSP